MRNLFISFALLSAVLSSATIATAKVAPAKVNSATCNYGPEKMIEGKNGQQNYKISCVRETARGYQVWTYGIGENQAVTMAAFGKSTLVFNQKTRTLMDGKKVVFDFKGSNVRSATTPAKKSEALFSSKTPTLGQFANYFNKYSICAQ